MRAPRGGLHLRMVSPYLHFSGPPRSVPEPRAGGPVIVYNPSWKSVSTRLSSRSSQRRAIAGMVGPTSEQRQPVDVGVYSRQQTVEIKWSDDHLSSYGFEYLRWLCPCAVCRGEAGSKGILDFTTVLTPDQHRLTDLQQVGNYALTPRWADGHDSGIYSWDYFRRACPCDECRSVFGNPLDRPVHER